MSQDSEAQMAFEFQIRSDDQSKKVSQNLKIEVFKPTHRTAEVYSLAAVRTAEISRESAKHFSAILNLVAHLK